MRLAWSTLLPAAACTYYFTRFLKKILPPRHWAFIYRRWDKEDGVAGGLQLVIGGQLSLRLEQLREFCSTLCSEAPAETILEENCRLPFRAAGRASVASTTPRLHFPLHPWPRGLGINRPWLLELLCTPPSLQDGCSFLYQVLLDGWHWGRV